MKMQANAINKNIRIKPLKYPLDDMPHATIETNSTCNIQCKICYNLYRDQVKSLEEVKDEIAQICRIRNLQAITLLGGEPTLHPELCEIVAYIKSKRLICQILTNGIVFLEDKQNHLLDSLKAAGVDKILLHIDNGQAHIHSDIEGVRKELFIKLERKKISFSLSITIFNEDVKMLPLLVKRYSRYRYFDGILAVLARDPLPPRVQKARLQDEYESLAEELNIEPIAYIPSHIEDESIHWLKYLYLINAKTQRAFGVSPMLNRSIRRVYRVVKRRHLFVIKIKPENARVLALFTLFGEVMIHPRRIGEAFSLLKKSSLSKVLRFHYLAIQKPPEFNQEWNCIQICYHCPDATIRNGRLTPVCIADKLHSRNETEDLGYPRDYYLSVYKHLGT